jgi:hypothetical protein
MKFSKPKQSFDVKKREKLLWKAQKIILEDAPAVPLWNSMDIYVHRADLVWTAPPDEKVQLPQGSSKRVSPSVGFSVSGVPQRGDLSGNLTLGRCAFRGIYLANSADF